MSRTWFLSVVIALTVTVPGIAAGGDRVSSAPSRGLVLPALYASFAALNVYDAASTRTALKRGAVEANPLMGGLARHPTAMWMVKAGVTTASIAAADNLWRQHHRGQAIALMIATNGVMAAVAVHNASVIGGLK